MKTVDVLVKTYPKDYPWLKYLWRSFAKYATGYRNIVVLLEEGYPVPHDLPSTAVVKYTRRYVGTDFPSNLGSVIERLRAWAYTDADAIILVDSDCVWSRPVDLQTEPTLFDGDKPVVLWRHWHDGVAWLRPPAAKTLGYMPTRETMCRYPFCYSRAAMQACWDFIGGDERLYGLTTKAERDADGKPPASKPLAPTDLNVLGNFMLDHAADQVTARHWHDGGPPCIRQFWSFCNDGPNDPEVQAALRELGLLS